MKKPRLRVWTLAVLLLTLIASVFYTGAVAMSAGAAQSATALPDSAPSAAAITPSATATTPNATATPPASPKFSPQATAAAPESSPAPTASRPPFTPPPSTAEPITLGARTAITLQPDAPREFAFTPATNSQYAVYLFPDTGGVDATVELLIGHKVLATGADTVELLVRRLTANRSYTLRLTGTGSYHLEIARASLSRCFSMPLALKDGGSYTKLIARGGDVHWYEITAEHSGAAILTGIAEGNALTLSATLFSADGAMLAQSDTLPSGAFAMSARFEQDVRYLLRLSDTTGATGNYSLSMLRSAQDPAYDAVAPAEPQLTVAGRSRAILHAQTSPGDDGPLVFWNSGNPEIVSVTPGGLLQGRSPGTATVTLYAYGGARAECTVTVSEVPVEGLSFTADSLRMKEGEDVALDVNLQPGHASNAAVSFLTDDESVVTVDADGVVRAIGVGQARVVAVSADGNFSDSIQITVEQGDPHYRALLIGEQNYASTVDTVRVGSIHSVESLQSLLGTMRFGDAAFATRTLMDATRDEALATIRSFFADATERDVSMIYITCHGFYRSGTTFFVMTDGSVLSALDFERELRGIPGKIVIMADCCGSGGLIESPSALASGVTDAFRRSGSVRGSKYLVLASTLPDQDSYRISFDSQGAEADMSTVFARALCDAAGWSMDRATRSAMYADLNYDSAITLNELYIYLSQRVLWYLDMAGGYQQNVQVYPEGSNFTIFARNATEE